MCDSDGGNGSYGDTMINAYLAEADQATADMASMIASALDRVVYLKKQLPEHQAQQIATAVSERLRGTGEISEEDRMNGDAGKSAEPAVSPATSASGVAR
jgi:osmotically-inducible protein OsmY